MTALQKRARFDSWKRARSSRGLRAPWQAPRASAPGSSARALSAGPRPLRPPCRGPDRRGRRLQPGPRRCRPGRARGRARFRQRRGAGRRPRDRRRPHLHPQQPARAAGSGRDRGRQAGDLREAGRPRLGRGGQLAAAAEAAGVLVTVPFVYRYYPTVRELRARLAAAAPAGLLSGGYLQDWLLDAGDYNWRVDPRARRRLPRLRRYRLPLVRPCRVRQRPAADRAGREDGDRARGPARRRRRLLRARRRRRGAAGGDRGRRRAAVRDRRRGDWLGARLAGLGRAQEPALARNHRRRRDLRLRPGTRRRADGAAARGGGNGPPRLRHPRPGGGPLRDPAGRSPAGLPGLLRRLRRRELRRLRRRGAGRGPARGSPTAPARCAITAAVLESARRGEWTQVRPGGGRGEARAAHRLPAGLAARADRRVGRRERLRSARAGRLALARRPSLHRLPPRRRPLRRRRGRRASATPWPKTGSRSRRSPTTTTTCIRAARSARRSTPTCGPASTPPPSSAASRSAPSSAATRAARSAKTCARPSW